MADAVAQSSFDPSVIWCSIVLSLVRDCLPVACRHAQSESHLLMPGSIESIFISHSTGTGNHGTMHRTKTPLPFKKTNPELKMWVAALPPCHWI